MDISTFYEAVVTDCDSRIAVRVIFVPKASMAPHAREALFEWGSLLGVSTIAELTEPEEVRRVLAALLAPAGSDADALASVILDQPQIPFGSTVGAMSLRAVLTETASDADRPKPILAALAGDRFLIVASRTGLLLVGASTTLAASLSAGLEASLRQLMGLDGREAEPLAVH